MSGKFQLFKALPGPVEDALRASIERFGVLVPVVKDQHGQILDGFHRSRIADELGVDYRVDLVRVADDEEAREIAATLNAVRRQLPPDERREVVKVLWELSHSQRAIAAALGVSQATVGEDIQQLTGSGQLTPPERTVGQDGKSRPARRPPMVPTVGGDEEEQARQALDMIGGAELPPVASVAEVRRMASASDAEVVVTERPNELSTAQLIVQSGEVEWYTPQRFIDAARAVLGGIDLDPASCAAANEVVGAATFYTAEDDGLSRPWFGRVWLNPPYGGLAADFVTRLIVEYEARRVKAGIVLVNAHSTDTAWFQKLLGYTVCFTKGRIDFWGPAREGASTPTHGSAFAYLGGDPERFTEEFRQFGQVVRGA